MRLSVYAARYGYRCGNFGDEASAWILRALGHDVEGVDAPEHANLFAVGSVLDRLPAVRTAPGWEARARLVFSAESFTMVADPQSLPAPARRIAVWGSALIDENHRCHPSADVRVFAVRGPLTRARLLPRWGFEDVTLGDPGILAREALAGGLGREHFAPRKLYRVGFLPHYADMDAEELCVMARRHRGEVTTIDPCAPPADVARRILECETVASSGLHGLIFAASLGVPAAWVKFGDRLAGGSFKFRDWYGALGWPDAVPVVLDGSRAVTLAEVEASARVARAGSVDRMREEMLAALGEAVAWLASADEVSIARDDETTKASGEVAGAEVE